MQCSYLKSNNEQCKANAMTNSKFCFTHNPETQEEKELAVIKGGLAPKPRKEEIQLDPLPITNSKDILALISDTINRIRTQPITAQKANAIGFLASIALKTMEVGELDKKVELINSLILERKIRIK